MKIVIAYLKFRELSALTESPESPSDDVPMDSGTSRHLHAAPREEPRNDRTNRTDTASDQGQNGRAGNLAGLSLESFLRAGGVRLPQKSQPIREPFKSGRGKRDVPSHGKGAAWNSTKQFPVARQNHPCGKP